MLSNSRPSTAGRIAFCLSLVPFLSFLAFNCLHSYKDWIGDEELVRRMMTLHPNLMLMLPINFLVWVSAAIASGYALCERQTRKRYPIAASVLVLIPLYPVVKIWVWFLSRR